MPLRLLWVRRLKDGPGEFQSCRDDIVECNHHLCASPEIVWLQGKISAKRAAIRSLEGPIVIHATLSKTT